MDEPQALVSDAVDLIEHDSPSLTRTVVAGSPLPFYQPAEQILQVGSEAFLFQGRTAQRLRTR